MRNPCPKETWDFIESQVRPTHEDAIIHLEMQINSLTLNEGETIPQLLNRFSILCGRLPPGDSTKIRHIKRAIANIPKMKSDYETEIRTLLMSEGITFDEFSRTLLRRNEELKYEREQLQVNHPGTQPQAQIPQFEEQSNYIFHRGSNFSNSQGRGGRGRIQGRGGRGRSFGRGRSSSNYNQDYHRNNYNQDYHRNNYNQDYHRNNYRGRVNGRSSGRGRSSSNFYGPNPNLKKVKFETANLSETASKIWLFENDQKFIIDSGCTVHMSGNLDLFEDYEVIDEAPGA